MFNVPVRLIATFLSIFENYRHMAKKIKKIEKNRKKIKKNKI